MPSLKRYSDSSDKSGYYIRANVGGKHPVTLQTTTLAEQIFDENGYSHGNSVPTKLVWSMYDVDLLYTQSSISSSTPSYAPDSFSDAVTKSELTSETRENLIRYFTNHSSIQEPRLNEILDELRTGGSDRQVPDYASPVELDRIESFIVENTSVQNEDVSDYLENKGSKVQDSLAVFSQKCTRIEQVDIEADGRISYRFSLKLLPGTATVYDHTPKSNSQYHYRIEYVDSSISSVYICDNNVEKVNGPSENLTESEAHRLSREIIPISIDKSAINTGTSISSVSDFELPNKLFLRTDPDLLVAVVDRISNSNNPVVEMEDEHVVINNGEEGKIYLINRTGAGRGHALFKLDQSGGSQSGEKKREPAGGENQVPEPEFDISTTENELLNKYPTDPTQYDHSRTFTNVVEDNERQLNAEDAHNAVRYGDIKPANGNADAEWVLNKHGVKIYVLVGNGSNNPVLITGWVGLHDPKQAVISGSWTEEQVRKIYRFNDGEKSLSEAFNYP